MKYYSIAELDITDRAWVRSYIENVTKMVEAAGGHYLARTSKIDKLEGARAVPQFYAIVEWPSREVAETFFDSEEYRPYRESRVAGTTNNFVVLVPAEDVTGAARMGE